MGISGPACRGVCGQMAQEHSPATCHPEGQGLHPAGQRLVGSDGEHGKSQGVKWLNLKNLETAAQNGLYIGKYAVRSLFGIL